MTYAYSLLRTGWAQLRTLLLLLTVLDMGRATQAAPGAPALAAALNPDGTLRPGARGSFDGAGYTLHTAPDGRPTFRPVGTRGTLGAGDENWADGFTYPGTNYNVYALAIDGSGNVYVGGEFFKVGRLQANSVAKWNGTTWSALGTGMITAGTNTESNVRALAVDGSGNVYAGGDFTTAGGVTASRVAKWDGTAWSALGAGTNNDVQTLAVDGSGNVYVGGYFTTAGGATVNHVAKWNGTAWSALGAGTDNEVYALVMDGSGNVYAGGNFTTAGGATVNYVAKWSGTAWSSLDTGMNGGVNGFVEALTINRGDVYAGGSFTTAGGVPRYNYYSNGGVTALYIAKWNGTKWSALGEGVDSDVKALALDGSGNVYAGGSIIIAGGVLVNGIAKWNGTAWSALGTGMGGGYLGRVYKVYALAVDGSGNVYAGGDFTTAGGVLVNGIAKWNGTAWSALGTGMNGSVLALAVDGSGNVYATGDFTTAGGVSVNSMAKWNGTVWSDLGSGIYSTSALVFALAIDASGNVYAGGGNTQFGVRGGVNCKVAKWNGTAWSPLPIGMYGDITSLAMDGRGNLYAGAGYVSGGGTFSRTIAKWDGTAWSSLGTGPNGDVQALVVDGSGNVYAGGYFPTAGGVATNSVAKWNGTAWSSLGTGLGADNSFGFAGALAVDHTSTFLYVGGTFTSVGDQSKLMSSFGRYTLLLPAPVPSFRPSSGVAGTAVVLDGVGLNTVTAIRFNGTLAPGFTVNALGTQLTVRVPVGATTGVISITQPAGPTTYPATFTVNQPAAGKIVVDGYREDRYGTALAVQTTPTGFGNATNGSQTVADGGSELDAAYARVSGDSVYVFLAGNFENNGNALELFFDSKPGGQNVLASNNPSVDANGLNNMAGLTFDSGFGADYYLSVKARPTGTGVDAYFASLTSPGAFAIDPATTGTGRVVPLNLGAGKTGVLALDNSNTGGVSDVTVGAGVPAAVVAGIELVLPLSALGSPTGTLNVAAFINGTSHNYLSNQTLGGLPNGTANLGSPATVNFAAAANAGNQYFTIPLSPPVQVLSFMPASGPVGTVVTLTGLSFAGTSSVRFNGTLAPGFVVNSAGTQLTVAVPAGATTGPMSVTTPVGTGTSSTSFTVIVPAPVLSSLSPTSGPVGTTLTITGANLTGTTSISFAGSSGNTVSTGFVVNAAGTQITGVVVPAGAATGLVTATTAGGTSNGVVFTVIPRPVLSSLSPADGPVGTSVIITGTGLGGAAVVSFNGTTTTLANNTTTSLTVVVPVGATTGNVTVTTPGGVSNSLLFTVVPRPVLTTLSPTSGPVGTVVTVTGTDLSGATQVQFSALTVNAITNNTATGLRVTVPTGATTGSVTVTTPGGVSNGLTFTVTTVSATHNPTVTGLQVFPNPARDEVTVHLSTTKLEQPLTLIDDLGREVRRYPAPTGTEAILNLRGLPAGLYVLRRGAWGIRLVVME